MSRNWKYTPKEICIDLLVDIIGTFLGGIATYNFAAAAALPVSGLNGIALILYHLFGLPIGATALAMNIPVVLVCARFLGKRMLVKSAKSLLIITIMIDYVCPLFPVYQGDKLLAAICAGAIGGVGYGMIYMRGSTVGGMDFVMMSIKAKKPYMSLGKITMILSSVVILAGVVIVSKNIDALIYGILLAFITSAAMDRVMYGMNAGKMALIVTDYAQKVADAISEETHRGATFLSARGSYTGAEKHVVMVACSERQIYDIRTAAESVDPNTFMIILNSSEIYGVGFKLRNS